MTPTDPPPDPAPRGGTRRLASIILAAGSGTRMRMPDRHKACLPLEGRPVLARAMDTYARCGVEVHVVVVGAMADQVMRAVEDAAGARLFCHQAEQRGTGHAARIAAEALAATGYSDDLLVVAGDKVLEEAALRRLIEAFHREDADLAFLTARVEDFPSAGRVVFGPAGRPAGIVEAADIARARTLASMRTAAQSGPIPAADAERMALAAFGRADKARTALGGLWDAITSGEAITRRTLERHFPKQAGAVRLNGQILTEDQCEGARDTNLSVYLFRAPALYEALARIGADNAQGEEYLTDAVAALAALGRRIITVPVQDMTDVMSYNTPEEFHRIEERLRTRAGAIDHGRRSARTVSQWLNALDSPAISAALSSLYGANGVDTTPKIALLRSALDGYARRFGDGPVLIARAPGRLNVMGRHVDHQGGAGNLIAINRETFAVMGAREDGAVRLHSIIPSAFPDRAFAMEELESHQAATDWPAYVNSEAVRARCANGRGDWGLYVQAAAARFRARAGRPLRGFNAVVAGDIPIAAGLSSSSALVVATATGLCEMNGLHLAPEEFVALCGEAEWYTGTRGGAGDHAAMVFGRSGFLAQFRAHPYELLTRVPLPDDHAFLVCDSHGEARKTAGARDAFNHRVACYHIGRELIKARRPDLAHRIEHLRDVNEARLGLPLPELIGCLRDLPETMTREEVRRSLPGELVEPILATHSEAVGVYPVRAVVVFGLAECDRSMDCADLLRMGDLETFGRWMAVSHDGDRVSRSDPVNGRGPYSARYDDGAMSAWIASAERGERSASLAEQPGSYACSTPVIDAMVDIALSTPGVLGAQISGAGLGGCMMALARRDTLPELEQAMRGRFYDPEGLEPRLFTCVPVAGSGLLDV